MVDTTLYCIKCSFIWFVTLRFLIFLAFLLCGPDPVFIIWTSHQRNTPRFFLHLRTRFYIFLRAFIQLYIGVEAALFTIPDHCYMQQLSWWFSIMITQQPLLLILVDQSSPIWSLWESTIQFSSFGSIGCKLIGRTLPLIRGKTWLWYFKHVPFLTLWSLVWRGRLFLGKEMVESGSLWAYWSKNNPTTYTKKRRQRLQTPGEGLFRVYGKYSTVFQPMYNIMLSVAGHQADLLTFNPLQQIQMFNQFLSKPAIKIMKLLN